MSFLSNIWKSIRPYASKIGTAIGSIWGPAGASVGAGVGSLFEPSTAKESASDEAAYSGGGYVPVYPGDPQRIDITGKAPSFNWGQLVGPAASLGSGLLNYYGQRQSNAANAAMAQRQMDFQAQMSNTSYQRGVADMSAAGLNPMLAYSQGGASSPGGASATMQSETGGIAPATLQALQGITSIDLTSAQADNVRAQTEKTEADTLSALVQPELIKAQTHYSAASAKQVQQAVENMLADLKVKQLEGEYGERTMGSRVSEAASRARGTEAAAKETEYGLAQAKESERFYKDTGQFSFALKILSQLLGSANQARHVWR